jgi:hypothetical protein
MFESSIPQNNNDLDAEKGPACDIRHRFSFSAVYEIPDYLSGAERLFFHDFCLRGYCSGFLLR